MFCRYVLQRRICLQRRQGHHSGFHSLIAIYKTGIYKTPMYKTGTKTSKFNYRPVSILSNISKIYERLMFEQMSESTLNLFYQNFNVVSEKGLVLNTAFCQCKKNGKWLLIIKKTFGSLISNLSKDFDWFSHDLLLAKLNASGFSITDLRLMLSYLSNRKQTTKTNSEFSSREEILFGVPQRSFLGPLLFNIILCDFFFIMDVVDFASASYADDNTPFFEGNDLDEVNFKLQSASKFLFQCLQTNK